MFSQLSLGLGSNCNFTTLSTACRISIRKPKRVFVSDFLNEVSIRNKTGLHRFFYVESNGLFLSVMVTELHHQFVFVYTEILIGYRLGDYIFLLLNDICYNYTYKYNAISVLYADTILTKAVNCGFFLYSKMQCILFFKK